MSSINSITKGPRQSNFELLRIIAMGLVLVVHADFNPIGVPTLDDLAANPLNAIMRTFIEALSIVCVNIFVMISGWFGIKPTLKGFMAFIFQCVFFYGVIYAAAIFAGYSELSFQGVATALCLTSETGWFIKAYIALYLLSPIINVFLEKATKRQLQVFLISFYLFQTIYTIGESTDFILEGYSPFSFIGLYVMARYLKMYWSNISRFQGLAIYLGSAIVLTFLYYLSKQIGLPIDSFYYFQYSNVFVITGAAGLLLWANAMEIKPNRYINWVSRSVFAVYLFHLCPNIPWFYKEICSYIYNTYSGIEYWGVVSGFVIAVFIVSIVLDQPRKWLWSLIARCF